MNEVEELGPLIEEFVNLVSHPRGRVLKFLTEASVTVDQAILLNLALVEPGSTPSSLATAMNISLPSVSQMIERLVKVEFVKRIEDSEDRRRRTIKVTAKARKFLAGLKAVRCSEFEAGTATLSPTTRRQLAAVLSKTLNELAPSRRAERRWMEV